ncbi:MAG: hypothetical protein JWN25_766 [Verrucomicrobiales bacterium]|nr:hypothetical protein [Verrucomicrobiales bacterium]
MSPGAFFSAWISKSAVLKIRFSKWLLLVCFCLAGKPDSFASTNILSTFLSFTNVLSGIYPSSGVLEMETGSLLGVTSSGGIYGDGTIFKINRDGEYSVLFSFGDDQLDSVTNISGSEPLGGLTKGWDRAVYGTTQNQGEFGNGTIFRITETGEFSVMHSFGEDTSDADVDGDTNEDGKLCDSTLVAGPDGSLYGTAHSGGHRGAGTLFKLSTNGLFSVLHTFSETTLDLKSYTFKNAEGAQPSPGLCLGNDGNFYGTTFDGGTNGNGTVFKITPSGSFVTIYHFSRDILNPSSLDQLNKDGVHPCGPLAKGVDGNFYGSAGSGGMLGMGTVFKITPSGSFTTIHSFTGNSDGRYPTAGLFTASDGSVYGTTPNGLPYATSCLFKIRLSGEFSVVTTLPDSERDIAGANFSQAGNGNIYFASGSEDLMAEGKIFAILPSTPASVVQQPREIRSKRNSSAKFEVKALGNGNVTYQWYFENGELPGQTNVLLELNNVSYQDSGSYHVIITDAGGFVKSDPAHLALFEGSIHSSGPLALSELLIADTIGSDYLIEMTDKLGSAQWVSLSTVKLQSKPASFLDSANTNSTRFYRVTRLENSLNQYSPGYLPLGSPPH